MTNDTKKISTEGKTAKQQVIRDDKEVLNKIELGGVLFERPDKDAKGHGRRMLRVVELAALDKKNVSGQDVKNMYLLFSEYAIEPAGEEALDLIYDLSENEMDALVEFIMVSDPKAAASASATK